jgi:hypothetical protein
MPMVLSADCFAHSSHSSQSSLAETVGVMRSEFSSAHGTVIRYVLQNLYSMNLLYKVIIPQFNNRNKARCCSLKLHIHPHARYRKRFPPFFIQITRELKQPLSNETSLVAIQFRVITRSRETGSCRHQTGSCRHPRRKPPSSKWMSCRGVRSVMPLRHLMQ